MPAPSTTAEFLELVQKSGLIDPARLEPLQAGPPPTPRAAAETLIRDGLLTRYQADLLLAGKCRGFFVSGKYKLLGRLGAGGMGSVYLCRHVVMHRLVALKVLPNAQAKDPSSLERFRREARAVARLDHPNIIRAHDIDQDGKLNFLVMEYVDGRSLQQIVDAHGPMDVVRAAHYVRQAALGLQHAHEAGVIHRDIKPGNLLLDRGGVVKVLDMGLARFFQDDDRVTKQYDAGSILGTADYLAPEQALDSHRVDIRADIYSLGATFYFLLAGRGPFQDGTVTQKLIWVQTRQPKPIRELRPDVPEELAAVIARMMEKDPARRYQVPAEVAEALAPWAATPIPPPPEAEMPPADPALSQPLSPGRAPAGPGNVAIQPRPAYTPAERLPGTPTSSAVTLTHSGTPADGGSPRFTASGLAGPPSAPPAAGRVRRAVWAAAALVAVMAAGAGAAAWWLLDTKPAPTAAPAPVAAEGERAANGGKPGPASFRAGAQPTVVVAAEQNTRRITTPRYEAVIDADGCLNSLRVGGAEVLAAGVPLNDGKSVSHGSYFFSTTGGAQGAVSLPVIEQPAANVIKAGGDKFTARYEFEPDRITWELTNASDAAAPFYIILDCAALGGMRDAAGQLTRVPVARAGEDRPDRRFETTTWFAGKYKLTLRGGTKIWGPWTAARYQVWETDLGSYETGKVVLEIRDTTRAEAAALAALPFGRRVQTADYEAVVADDGCLTSLRVDGVEFLRPDVDVSRGIYLHQDGLVRLPQVEQPSRDLITARGDRAAVRYEFGPKTITCTATNATDKGMSFFIVFDPAVSAVLNDKGEAVKTPAVRGWPTTTWLADGVTLKVTNANQIWGPWPDQGPQHLQVCQAVLGPKEVRKVVLETGVPSEAEAAKFAAAIGQPVARSSLTVQSPQNDQVFQRRTRLDGEVVCRGRVRVPCDRVEAKLTGKPLEGTLPDRWEQVPFRAETRTFDGPLPAPAGGWYRLEVRTLKDKQVVAQAAVGRVGVGEVFVCAGQSNSTNCGDERTRQESGMVSSFSGSYWQPADDPQPGVHDGSQGGSCWPAFGDALYARDHVPVGIASAGHSGTSINEWQPGGELFQWVLGRMNQLGPHGFRAVLWHQGESDVGMSAQDYAHRLGNVIRASRRAAGWDVPWFVAQVSYHNPANPTFATTRAGQKKLWDEGVALEGPDTDTLTGDNRDQGGRGIHFSPKGLKAHGRMWAEKVGAYLDRVLKEGK